MKNNNLASFIITALIVNCFSTVIFAQMNLDLESGVVFTGYNDVRIPGSTGTSFSLKNTLKPKATPFFRLRATYTIKSRHTISLLYAPLVVKSSGSADQAIDFAGKNFAPNTTINAHYQFNSYRITYRYDFVKRPKIDFGLGFTAKIRDAEIALQNDFVAASKKNVGFVPIVNFRLNCKVSDKIHLLLEGDALVASQGRAEDVQLAGTYKITENCLVRLGYRILEGGADGGSVYNFTLFHYAIGGVSYIFKQK